MTVNDVDLLVGHDYFVDPNDCSLYIATYWAMTMEKKKTHRFSYVSFQSFPFIIHSLKFTSKKKFSSNVQITITIYHFINPNEPKEEDGKIFKEFEKETEQ